MMWRRFFAWVSKYERHLSAAATIGGVIIDQVFFQRIDLLRTQVIFATYTVICFITIPLLHYLEARAARGIAKMPRWKSVLPIITQFTLGGFWSGFLFFYGRSAVISAAWPFLLLLFAIMLGNEILKKYHERLVFTAVLFFFALYSYAIFELPIYTGMIGTRTFLESGLVAIVLFAFFTILLRILGHQRFLNDVWRIRVGAFVVLILINFFYFTNILPPLPLSAKAGGIYHSVWHVPGAYLAEAEPQSWKVRYLGEPEIIHIPAGDSVYAYSSVFAPTTLATTIVHRWQWYNPVTEEWETRTAISYPIVGGRDGGYRGYSAIVPTLAGQWRVNVETVSGLLIERLPFTLILQTQPPVEQTITLP